MQGTKSNNFRIINSQFSEGAGFTLIEVIVAVAILSVSLVMIMQLFAAGLKASRASCDYTRAVMHAMDKMAELSVSPISPQEKGEFRDGYKWEADAQTYEEFTNKEQEDVGFKLLKLKVKIMWSGGAKKENSVELESLKMVSAEEAKNL
ncbi:MAG: prepilin-type N-terminal cleavage/methylation domain-containing protein [Nitrospirae bacterium]|nr:prepilin-type N-terminal cleavage/methylation domain-containing protein [Nitrospirota bacterium]